MTLKTYITTEITCSILKYFFTAHAYSFHNVTQNIMYNTITGITQDWEVITTKIRIIKKITYYVI